MGGVDKNISASRLSHGVPVQENTKPQAGDIHRNSDEMSLKELIVIVQRLAEYLKSQWHIFIIMGLLGGIGGLTYAYLTKSLYIAETTFVLEDEKSGGMGSYSGLASQFGSSMGMEGGQGVFEGENLLTLMRSRLMIEKALLSKVSIKGKDETLAELYIEINHLRDEWVKNDSYLKNISFPLNSDPAKFSQEQNSLITSFHSTIISNNMIVDKLDKKSSIISLIVKSENELFAKFLSDALTKEVSKFYIETKTKKSSENVRILQYQTDSVRRELNLSMSGVASSVDANPNPNLARQILRVPSQRKQVDVQVNQAILSQLVQNLEIAKMSLRTETPLIQVIDSPILPLRSLAPSRPIQFIKWGLIASFVTLLFLVIKRFLTTF